MEILERSMVVEWQAPDDDGGSPITGYRLEARKVCIINRRLTDFTDTNSTSKIRLLDHHQYRHLQWRTTRAHPL